MSIHSDRVAFELLEPRRLRSSAIHYNLWPDDNARANTDAALERIEKLNESVVDGNYHTFLEIDANTQLLASRNGTITGLLGSFEGPLSVNDYAVTVFWGDNQVSNATLIASGDGGYNIVGTHDYADAGLHAILVDVQGSDGSEGFTSWYGTMGLTGADSLTTTDSPHVMETIGDFVPPGVKDFPTTPVGMFYDIDRPNGDGSGYAATVDWGDGTQSTGTVRQGVDGGYFVEADTYTYSQAGTFNVTFSVERTDGSASMSNTGMADVHLWSEYERFDPDGSVWWYHEDCAGDFMTPVRGPGGSPVPTTGGRVISDPVISDPGVTADPGATAAPAKPALALANTNSGTTVASPRLGVGSIASEVFGSADKTNSQGLDQLAI